MAERILITDDDKIFRYLVKEILIEEGYEVIEAENGKQALEILKNGKIDLVILDVDMPEMNGFETLNKIREDENLFNIPVIMLTVKAMMEDQLQGFEYGADEYLAKPFESQILLAKIKNLLTPQ